MLSNLCRSGEVLKTDETSIFGSLLSFDGNELQIASSTQARIPIRDIARVRFQPPSDTSRRVPQLLWQLTLVGGDCVRGNCLSWTEDRFNLELQQGGTLLHVPTACIREVWHATPEQVQRAMRGQAPAKNEDIAYVLKENDIITVKGTALGVEGHALSFLFEGQPRKINLDRLLGVFLASQKRSPATELAAEETPVAQIVLINGDRLSGRWMLLKDNLLSLQTSWEQAVVLPTETIAFLEIRNAAPVYLSDLKPVKVEQTPYFDRIIPWRADASLAGGPLKLNDAQHYAHGIAMHSRCVLEYELDGPFQRFQARLGFEPLPEGSPAGRAAVRITIDNRTLFENPDLRSTEKPQNLTLDINGGRRLTLEVDFGQDQDVNDRIVWANARLLRVGAPK